MVFLVEVMLVVLVLLENSIFFDIVSEKCWWVLDLIFLVKGVGDRFMCNLCWWVVWLMMRWVSIS